MAIYMTNVDKLLILCYNVCTLKIAGVFNTIMFRGLNIYG